MPKYVSNGGDWKEVNKPVEITIEDKPVVIEKPVVEEPVVKVKEEAVKFPKKRTYKRKK